MVELPKCNKPMCISFEQESLRLFERLNEEIVIVEILFNLYSRGTSNTTVYVFRMIELVF